MQFRRARSAVFLVALSFIPGPARPATGETATPLTVGGQLLDETGRPMPGGRVEAIPAPDRFILGRRRLGLEPEPAPAAWADTDAEGVFRLRVPAVGHWRLRITGPDRLSHEETLPVVEPLELGALRGTRGQRREVTVVDADGRPVAGARVTVLGVVLGFGGGPAVTGGDGRAEIDLPQMMPRGELVVVPPTGVPFSTLLLGGSPRVTMPTAAPAAPVVVQDAAGRPVSQAVFWLWGQPINATDEQGRGHPPQLPGRQAGGGEDSALEIVAAGRWTGHFEGGVPGRLTPPVRLTGRVRSTTGTAVTGALVWPVGHPGELAVTDLEGRFELLASAPTRPTLDLVVAAAGFVGARIEVRPGGAPADLRLIPAARVAGQVVDAQGRPQAGFVVTAERVDEAPDELPPPRFRTAADGRFVLTGLAPAVAYRLFALRAEVGRAERSLAALAAGENRPDQRLVITLYRVAKGRVVDGAGDPIVGASASLTRVDEAPRFYGSELDGNGGSPHRRESDGTGRFRIAGLEPGRYDLRVRAPRYAAVTVRGLTIPAAGGEVDLGTVHLGPAATLRGRVVDAEDSPLAEAEISFPSSHLGALDFSEAPASVVFSAPDGSFAIPDLIPGGSLALTVVRPGFVRAEVPGVRVPREDELVIRLVAAARLSGRVLDGEGRGIEGAQVAAAESRWEGTTTDPTGAFLIEGLAPGPVQLVASARGFLEPPPKSLEIVAGEEVPEVVFELERGAVVIGRVAGPDGAPIDEAHVYLRDTTGFGTALTRADADGHYRLEGVPVGERRFAAGAEGLLETIRSLTVRAGDNRLDFRLERGLAIRGRVVGPDGQAVDQGEVSATEEPSGASQERGAIRPDSSFEVGNLKPGRYRLRADALDFAPAEAPALVTVGAGTVEGVVIQLTRGALIVGQVRGLGFDELTELQVVASALDGTQYSMGQVDFQGGFVLKNITPGSWTVMASSGNRQALERVDVEAGAAETRVEIEFGGGYTLTGRVSRGGRPVSGAGVLATTRQELTGGYATTDHDGRFEIRDLAAGEYQVAVATTWNGFAHSERVVIDGDREIAIEVVGLVLSGRVVSQGGDPLPGARVNLRGTESGELGTWGNNTLADEAGSFRFADVAPGRYVLQGQQEGYAQAEVELEVTDADAEAELRLSPSPGLVLEVSTARGPLSTGASLAVAAVDAQGRVVFRGHGEADERGRVRLSSAPIGSWTLWVSSHGQALTRLAVTNPGPPVPVQLEPGTHVQIEVPALRASTEIARLSLIGADGQLLPFLHQGLELAFEQMIVFGQGSVSEVPPGRWTVRVVTASGETLEKTVEVAPPTTRVVVE